MRYLGAELRYEVMKRWADEGGFGRGRDTLASASVGTIGKVRKDRRKDGRAWAAKIKLSVE